MTHPTLFTHPIKTLYYFSIVVLHFLRDALKYILRRWYLVVLLLSFTVVPRYVEGTHQKVMII